MFFLMYNELVSKVATYWLCRGGHVIRLALLLLFSLSINVAFATTRHVVVFVEEPLFGPDEPASPAQRETASELARALTRRLLALKIEKHDLENGATILENVTEKLSSADLILQLLLEVNGKGFKYKAQLYLRSQSKWIILAERVLSSASAEALKKIIVDELIPNFIVRAHEVAHPDGPPILFADCVYPPPADIAIAVARRYVGGLSEEPGLSDHFAVIRLVPLIESDFNWWCSLEERPIGRPNTTTVYGLIDQVGQPEVSIVVSNSGGEHPGKPIPLDPGNWPTFLKRVAETVKGLMNE
jgi:hypothetical protein